MKLILHEQPADGVTCESKVDVITDLTEGGGED